MRIKIQVIIESDDGRVQDVEEVACLKRGILTPEELGLNLVEAKEILQGVQQAMTAQQIRDYTAQRINCPFCGEKRAQKGQHRVVLRTVFGELTLSSGRLHQCHCQPAAGETFSPLAELLPERTAPELLYLEAKWCALLSFGMTLDLLQEVHVANPKKITLAATTKAFEVAFPKAELAGLFTTLRDEPKFKTLDELRNLLAHRLCGRRSMSSSSTLRRDGTFTIDWQEEIWHVPGSDGLLFDEQLLERQLNEIASLLIPLIVAARQFAEEHQPSPAEAS